MDIRSRTEQLGHLKEAQKEATLQRVVAAILELQSAKEPISFYSVAERAQVARSTLYRRDDLKKLVAQARNDASSENAEIAASPSPAKQLKHLQDKLDILQRENELLRHELCSSNCKTTGGIVYALIPIDWAA